ncbi:hypothetical protein BN844_3260 [Pseudomonas sp. SHC52]|nr:hypothetical protein BN844_3260 [Pseudomonas sp. SHC52]
MGRVLHDSVSFIVMGEASEPGICNLDSSAGAVFNHSQR